MRLFALHSLPEIPRSSPNRAKHYEMLRLIDNTIDSRIVDTTALVGGLECAYEKLNLYCVYIRVYIESIM